MKMKEDIGLWLQQAESDLESAKNNLRINEFGVAALLAQQAVEKGLKALFIKKFNKLKKTHDLVYLGRKIGLSEQQIKKCDELSPIYLQVRYPDASGMLTSKVIDNVKAKNLLKSAEELLEWIKKSI